MTRHNINSDIIIFGGGVAGLWLLNELSLLGLNCLLFENKALGAGQSGKAQGIIHGGIKYSLHGLFDPATRAIADMPLRWQQHFANQNTIDLSHVEVLSNAHYLWSNQHLPSRISHFLASKVLSCPGTVVSRQDYPTLFNHPQFQGYLTRVDETVINPLSLIQALSKKWFNRIFKSHSSKLADIQLNNDSGIEAITIFTDDNQLIHAKAQLYIFAAGEGNAALLESIPNAPIMQRRPLHMVALTMPTAHPLFAHYIGTDGQPRITITSHHDKHGKTVWYCGGQLAETGVNLTQTQQITAAQKILSECLPWVDLAKANWHSFFINRAEINQPNGKRPASFFAKRQKNYIVSWPTKLALTPAMSDDVMKIIRDNGIIPHHCELTALANWPKPSIAPAYWDAV